MSRRRKGNAISGWVVLDKPYGMTSTQAVGKIRHLFTAQKAGHAGTLDPLATGILPIALGEATKTVSHLLGAKKSYRFTIRFGEARNTDDAEGEIIAVSDKRPDNAEIEAVLPGFVGEISQVPPAFSAIKVEGKRAYDLARSGEAPILKARRVMIHEARLVSRPDRDHAELKILCGKGTYVRSLARDLAALLGSCGHVSALRRLTYGPFAEAQAITLDKLTEFGHIAPASEALLEHLLPLETALDDIPALAMSEQDAFRLRQGQGVLLRGRDAPILSGQVLATLRGDPVALVEYQAGELRPVRVFNLGS